VGRPSTIEHHPQKQLIDEAICSGEKQKIIAARFGITPAAITRYIQNAFARDKVRADQERQVSSGTFILANMMKMLDTLEKMREALVEQLQDPDDPSKFNLSPRADEIEVTYDTIRTIDDKVMRQKDTLQNLLEQVRAGTPHEIVSINIKTMDLRKLLLDTVDGVAKQMQLWLNTELAASSVRTDEAIRTILNEFIPLLLEEAENRPELKKHVARVLRSLKTRLLGSD